MNEFLKAAILLPAFFILSPSVYGEETPTTSQVKAGKELDAD
jgi:hypothetical protein